MNITESTGAQTPRRPGPMRGNLTAAESEYTSSAPAGGGIGQTDMQIYEKNCLSGH